MIPGAVNSNDDLLSDAADKVAGLMQHQQNSNDNHRNNMALVTVKARRSEMERQAARNDLDKDVLEWSEDDVYSWAVALGCDTAADSLRAHGVNGECLVEIGPDIFRECGVKTVGHLFRLEKARSALLPSHMLKREEELLKLMAVRGGAGGAAGGFGGRRGGVRGHPHPHPRATTAATVDDDDSDDDEDDDDTFGFVSKFKMASRRLITGALLSGPSSTKHRQDSSVSAAKAKGAVYTAPPPPPPRPKMNVGNLSDKAANARMKQAKSIGMVVVVVEAIVSLSGTMSLWPHLVAILPGSMAIQQYITAGTSTRPRSLV